MMTAPVWLALALARARSVLQRFSLKRADGTGVRRARRGYASAVGLGLIAGRVPPVTAITEVGGSEPIEEVVVTGSHLPSPNAVSASPVVVLDAEELLHQGTARAEDLLNSLPQVNSGLFNQAN